MATRIQDFNDTKFTSTENRSTIQYNSTDDKFDNNSPDEFLSFVPISSTFAEFVINNVDLNNFTNKTIDGGTF